MTLPTKQCAKCQQTLPLTSFAGRQRTCVTCVQTAKAKTLERKDQVAWSAELAERITDAIAAGVSVAEICASSWAPTERQLARWRRTIPEFASAYEEARAARADARSDRIDQTLRDLRDGKISAADARVIVETELKLAGKENPARYGERIEVTAPDALKASITAAMAIQALLAALPDLTSNTPIDKPIELLPSPSEGDGAAEAAGDVMAPAASSDDEPDPYAVLGEDLELLPARGTA